MSTLHELDAQHVWHPYTQHKLAPEPLAIVRAKGARLYTDEGQQFLDAISSWWVTLHGHAEPSIAKAIADQAQLLEQVIFAGCTHPPAAELAQKLSTLTGLRRVFYSDDGSTAVEVALKMALQFHQNRGERRIVIAALENSYHGDTFGSMSVSGRGLFTEPFGELLFEVARLPDPVEHDVVSAYEALLAKRSDVAALIVEPRLLAAGGMRMYSREVLVRLSQLSRRSGVLFIADEVATGFGRTGPLFATEGIPVDLMCVSKGVTGGFLPLGVTLATEDIYRAFLSDDRKRTFFHGHSYTGNPLACAAGLASLALLLSTDCTTRRARIAQIHKERLADVALNPRVASPRQLGTIAAFDLVAPKGYLSPIGRELNAYARERGVLLRPLGNVAYVMPPYGITDDELSRVWDVIAGFVKSLP